MITLIRVTHNIGVDVRATLVDVVADGEVPQPTELRVISGADYTSILTADGDVSVAALKSLLSAA